jgi:hypothetical protein
MLMLLTCLNMTRLHRWILKLYSSLKAWTTHSWKETVLLNRMEAEWNARQDYFHSGGHW